MEEKDLIRIYEDAKLDLSGKDLSKLLDKLNTLTQYNSVLDELEEEKRFILLLKIRFHLGKMRQRRV